MEAQIDVLIDLSCCSASDVQRQMDAVASPDGLAALTGDVTYLLPPNFKKEAEPPLSEPPIASMGPIERSSRAMERAGQRDRHLLILLGASVPGSEAVSTLIGGFERDPMFGFMLPRVAAEDEIGIEKVGSELGDPAIHVIPRRVLCELPDLYIVPECLGACVLIRDTLLANLGALDTDFKTLPGALLHYMCRARRIGFRCVIMNRAVVAPSSPEAKLAPDSSDVWRMLRLFPDMGRSRAEMTRLPLHQVESFLARAAGSHDLRRTLLIDGRGMGPYFNGTSHCVLGLADGLCGFPHDWNITLVVKPGAAAFHDLAERYPTWTLTDDISSCCATAAIRVSQPWAISTMMELHRQALFNFYMVLDTISWDILFEAPEGLDGTWRFLSTHADGLLYISDFTGERFRMRFPLAPSVREHTMYLSFHPRDYFNAAVRSAQTREPYILVIGNLYDHKNLASTVDAFADCFPFELIKTVGLPHSDRDRVMALPSGNIAEEEMDRLYANARLVVFPSYYEGFGFPVIRGLSYGRTVLARQSALLNELAANYRGPGRLIGFRNPIEMLELAGRVLHEQDVATLRLGEAVPPDGEPLDWIAIGRKLLQFIGDCTALPRATQWVGRENAIQQILAYKT